MVKKYQTTGVYNLLELSVCDSPENVVIFRFILE